MAVFTGATGKLFLNDTTDNSAPGTEIAKVQNWSVSSSVSLISNKTLGDTDDTFVPIGRSTTGSCRILYYQEVLGTPNANDSASTFLNKVFKPRSADSGFGSGASLDQNDADSNLKNFRLRLHVNDGTTSGKFIDMRVFITNISLSMSVGDIVAADIQFQCQGAPVAVNI
tara:strand:- start:141 stop:650 length:510 start_codon:yes stop_codon:yes gene_type:complete